MLSKNSMNIGASTPCNCGKSRAALITTPTVSAGTDCGCLCCCGPFNGISSTQCANQILPNGNFVTNPFYSLEYGATFISYSFYPDCAVGTEPIDYIGFPICETLTSDQITVYQKVNSSPIGTVMPYTLTKDDPNFGVAPAGFQWLLVIPTLDCKLGVRAEYQIEVLGKFDTEQQPLYVEAGGATLVYDCCFLVFKCDPKGQLTVNKECGYSIVDNNLTLLYTVTVNNVGTATVDPVNYFDSINTESSVTFGTITVDPDIFTITSNPGQIVITGDIGPIEPSETKIVTYQVQVINISSPGTYSFMNQVVVSGFETSAMAMCEFKVPVIKLMGQKCCVSTSNNNFEYKIAIGNQAGSPATTVNFTDLFSIPQGIVLQFLDYDGFDVRFQSDNTIVPLNTPISGPVAINIIGSNISIPANGVIVKSLKLQLISTDHVGTKIIENELLNISLASNSTEILLGVDGVPSVSTYRVVLSLKCKNPCAIPSA